MVKRKTKQEPKVSEQDLLDNLEGLMLEFDEEVLTLVQEALEMDLDN